LSDPVPTARLRAAVTPARLIAVAALVLAAALVIALPPNPLSVVAAVVATLALATEPKLGPLPAALLVALVLPWGRGADTLTWELAGLPIRPHDGAIAVGLLGAAPVLLQRRPRLSPLVVLLGAFLALGLVGLVVGLVLDNSLRDIFRDVRWWVFYGAAALALFGATTRPRLIRALVIGTTLFAVLVTAAALLPVFPDGLKEQELVYDRGTLRMQFGNSAFLLPAIAWASASFLRSGRAMHAAITFVLLGAVVLSLTRTSIAASVLVLGLVCLAAWWRARPHVTTPAWIRRVATDTIRLGGLAAAAFVIAIVVDIAGTPPATELPTSGGSRGERPLDRILFQEERSDLGSLQQGRFPSYRAAAAVILDSPAVGAGLGSLTDVDYAYSDARANVIGKSPGVDNAYLTVGLKTGIPGIVVFAALVATSFLLAFRRGGALSHWFVPAWIGLGILSMTQAFAVSLYGPFAVAMLLTLPALTRGSSVPRAGAPQGSWRRLAARLGARG
jgi:hypothetical protein